MGSDQTDLSQVAAASRGARRVIERGVLPLASSVDGIRFEFQAALDDLALQVGGYVVLETGATGRLGQILTLRIADAKAFIMGRNMFGPVRGESDRDRNGWWGDDPPYHRPPTTRILIARWRGGNSADADYIKALK
ncbi:MULTISPECIES: hypothetical protein [unclassified Kribbella]|uniref:hypothetical protein n=1 Tax=unclassified Kribbella TaxID=2644121 RepID=UPI003016E674